MSGAEIIGLISGIISLIDVSVKIVEAIDDASGLPKAFRDVAARLPLVQDTLETTQADFSSSFSTSDIGENSPSSSNAALTKVLRSCHDKMEALNKIFQVVIPASGASRARRYQKVLKTVPRAAKVEDLMAGILADLQVVTGNHAVKAATRAQMEDLIAAVKVTPEVSKGSSPIGKSDDDGRRSSSNSGVQLWNYGAGRQILNIGGDQNVVSENGVQVNGASGATFYFGRT